MQQNAAKCRDQNASFVTFGWKNQPIASLRKFGNNLAKIEWTAKDAEGRGLEKSVTLLGSEDSVSLYDGINLWLITEIMNAWSFHNFLMNLVNIYLLGE